MLFLVDVQVTEAVGMRRTLGWGEIDDDGIDLGYEEKNDGVRC